MNPRWSPDGKYIALISNRSGNTSLWIQEALSGRQTEIAVKERHYLKPMGRLVVRVLDATAKPTFARLFVTGADGRAYAPNDAWIQAEDNFVRSQQPFESHYFASRGTVEIAVPAGRVDIEVMKGFEYRVEKRSITVASGAPANLAVRLAPLKIPKETNSRWVSADLHVHMNYGGAYRNTPKHLVEQAAAENLPIVEDLVVNKEQRIPDMAYFSTKPDAASTPGSLLLHGGDCAAKARWPCEFSAAWRISLTDARDRSLCRPCDAGGLAPIEDSRLNGSSGRPALGVVEAS